MLISVSHFVGFDGRSLGIKLRERIVVAVDDEEARSFGWQEGDIVEAVNGRGLRLV